MFITMTVGGVLTAVAVGATIGAVMGHMAVVKTTRTYAALKAGLTARHLAIMAKYGKLHKESNH